MNRAVSPALWALRRPETVTLGLAAVTLLVGGYFAPQLLDARYLLGKTGPSVPLGVLAVAMTLVIAAGQIDLSVASGTVLCSVVAGLAYRAGAGMGVTVAVSLATGLLLGCVNGTLVGYLRLPALVVTLGTLALYRGIAQVLIGNDTVRGFPEWFAEAYDATVGPVPLPLAALLVLGVGTALVLGKTTLGRRLEAVGTNEEAARYAGVDVARVKLAAFAASGLSMGVAAVLLMSQLDMANHLQLRGGELLAITAVVLGGTWISGGRGTVVGTLLAFLLLVIVDSAMGMNLLRAEYKLAIVGTLLVVAVLVTRLTGRSSVR